MQRTHIEAQANMCRGLLGRCRWLLFGHVWRVGSDMLCCSCRIMICFLVPQYLIKRCAVHVAGLDSMATNRRPDIEELQVCP